MDMWGGKRQGAGRPKGSTIPKSRKRQTVTISLSPWVADWLRNHPESSGRLVERALIMVYGIKKPSQKPVERRSLKTNGTGRTG